MTNTRAIAIGPAILAAIQDGNSAFMLVKSSQGWQCSMKRPDGRSYHVIVETDPIDAAYRCIVPWDRQDKTSQPLPIDVGPFAGTEARDPHDLFRPYDPSEAKG